MIEYTSEQRTELKALIAERAPKYGFDFKGTDLIPNSISKIKQDMRLNMFLAIGINSTGRCKSFISIREFIRRGINRFFLSIRNRADLDPAVLKANKLDGKCLICADFYIAPAVFNCTKVPDTIIKEWNNMMRSIRVKPKHGIVCIKAFSPKDNTTVKYLWYDRQTKK